MLKNYNNPDFVFGLPYRDGYDLVIELYNDKNEQRTWEFYLTVQQTLVMLNPHKKPEEQVNFESYEEFKEKIQTGGRSQIITEAEKDRLRAIAQSFNERLVRQ